MHPVGFTLLYQHLSDFDSFKKNKKNLSYIWIKKLSFDISN